MTRFDKDVYKDPKNESSQRIIKVPQFIIDILKDYRKKNMNNDRVIYQLKPQSYSNRFHNILTSIGLPSFRFHDLRHYNATLMLKSGIPDKVAAYRLGHAQVSTTREIYQHVLNEMDNLASDIISSAYKK